MEHSFVGPVSSVKCNVRPQLTLVCFWPNTSHTNGEQVYQSAIGSYFMFQIAAKIGGDGVAAPNVTSNEFSYGGQKRPLEDGGECSPMS